MRANAQKSCVESPEVVEAKEMMEQSVERGTGQMAKIPGYRIMGKAGHTNSRTGWSWLLKGEYIASFWGCFPLKIQICYTSIYKVPKKIYFWRMVSTCI